LKTIKARLYLLFLTFRSKYFFFAMMIFPEYVQDGIADLGIVGENVIEETEVAVSYLQHLGFGKCSLKIAVTNNSDITDIQAVLMANL
jgi:ATP phosphoribosyltransferase